MSAHRKVVVAVIFGGRSVEHDVSIVTAQQIMNAFDEDRYEVVPVYISRDGKWYTGDPLRDIKNFQEEENLLNISGVHSCVLTPDIRHHGLIIKPLSGRFQKSEVLRIDVAFPAVHGSHGEDGTLQGLFELADIAYVGCGVLSSALTNDKLLTKQVLRYNNLPVVDEVWFTREQWRESSDEIVQRIERTLQYPLFVKPATLGSSIGVSRVDNTELLRASIVTATHFDRRVLVEQAVQGIEINCAVMGSEGSLRTSVLEQPLTWADFLGFEDKYLRGSEGMKSADRIIPAPISDELTERIHQISKDAFAAVDGRGIARIDFLVQPDQQAIYINEINTMPGSLAFYLWQESGLSPSQVVDKLIELARTAQSNKRLNMYNYKTNLVHLAAQRGLKGVKGTKGRSPSVVPDSEPAS